MHRDVSEDSAEAPRRERLGVLQPQLQVVERWVVSTDAIEWWALAQTIALVRGRTNRLAA